VGGREVQSWNLVRRWSEPEVEERKRSIDKQKMPRRGRIQEVTGKHHTAYRREQTRVPGLLAGDVSGLKRGKGGQLWSNRRLKHEGRKEMCLAFRRNRVQEADGQGGEDMRIRHDVNLNIRQPK